MEAESRFYNSLENRIFRRGLIKKGGDEEEGGGTGVTEPLLPMLDGAGAAADLGGEVPDGEPQGGAYGFDAGCVNKQLAAVVEDDGAGVRTGGMVGGYFHF